MRISNVWPLRDAGSIILMIRNKIRNHADLQAIKRISRVLKGSMIFIAAKGLVIKRTRGAVVRISPASSKIYIEKSVNVYCIRSVYACTPKEGRKNAPPRNMLAKTKWLLKKRGLLNIYALRQFCRMY